MSSVGAMPTLGEIVAAVDRWYPPETAESWDSVGLSCGDPAEPVDRVLLAVDCVPATVAEAVQLGAGLLLTHHPLLLSPVHTVAASTAKGAMLHRMIRAGVAHFAAHTNADIAVDGVSAALADRLELRDIRPLRPDPAPPLDQLSVYVPAAQASALIAALAAAGAGSVGDYTECAYSSDGIGQFRPQPGAEPAVGKVGELHRGPETRVSLVLPRARRDAVLAAMRAAHPYEEVAFELTEQAPLPGRIGTGRIGTLAEPMPLRSFAEHALARLPRTAWGLRVAGRPDQLVRTVAVCGGSGTGYAEAARAAGAEAFLTADAKHHASSETVAELAGLAAELALLDAAHWATEAPWLDVLARKLSQTFDGLAVTVSQLVTDPWTFQLS